jgi:hypothetical protein
MAKTIASRLRDAAPVIAGALLGGLAWNTTPAALALAAVYPLGWLCCEQRKDAGGWAIGYHVGAACTVPFGAAGFFGDLTTGVVLTLTVAVALTLPWALLWFPRGAGAFPGRRFAGGAAALAITTVPPLGVIGWASPLAAAGVLYPGCGWLGLALLLALIALAWLVRERPNAARAYVFAAMLVAVLPTNGLYLRTELPPGWRGFDTAFGGLGFEHDDFMRDYRNNLALQEWPLPQDTRVAVFPESVAGWWSEASEQVWQGRASTLARDGVTMVIGALRRESGSRRNSLVAIGSSSGHMDQAIPVPVAMWKPDNGAQSFRLAPFAAPAMAVDGYTVTAIVCYEQVLSWPYLRAAYGGAQVWLAPANDYWALRSRIPAIQRNSLWSYGRLFGRPFIWAVNR